MLLVIARYDQILDAGASEGAADQCALTASKSEWCKDEVIRVLKTFFSMHREGYFRSSPDAWLHKAVQSIDRDHSQWTN